MVEDDGDIRFFNKRGDGDWEGNVGTYDFQTGTSNSVYTEIDADWFATHSDDVFDQSGYRRATALNVQSRLNGGGLIQTDVSGFRYTFMRRSFQ